MKRTKGFYLDKRGIPLQTDWGTLLDRYHNSNDEHDQQFAIADLIRQNVPLVKETLNIMFGGKTGLQAFCNRRRITYDDLFSAGVIGLYKAVRGFADGKWYKNFAITCIRNEIRMSIRGVNNAQEAESLDQPITEDGLIFLRDTVQDASRAIEEVIDSELLAAVLQDLQGRVDPVYYAMFVNYYIDEWNQDEVGKLYGISRSQVSKVLSKVMTVARKISV